MDVYDLIGINEGLHAISMCTFSITAALKISDEVQKLKGNKEAWLHMAKEANNSEKISLKSNQVSFGGEDKYRLRLSEDQHDELAHTIAAECSNKSMPSYKKVKMIELVGNRIGKSLG